MACILVYFGKPPVVPNFSPNTPQTPTTNQENQEKESKKEKKKYGPHKSNRG
jgi:hypothetical protein